MIMKYINLLVLLSVFSFPGLSQAEETKDITGMWLTKKKDAAVQVEKCGEELCGHVSWLKEGVEQFSEAGVPLCQAQVLYGFKSADADGSVWEGGTVYKADDDKSYDGILTLVDDNTVKLRAYIGIPLLGETKTLTRTSQKDYPPCVIPAKSYSQDLQNLMTASGN